MASILFIEKLVFMSNLLWTPYISMPLPFFHVHYNKSKRVQSLSTLCLTEEVLLVKSPSSNFSLAKMPPKKAAGGPSKKTEQKKKEKVIEVREINH